MELLIPTLNKISSYKFLLLTFLLEGTNHEQSSQNNQCTWCLPPPPPPPQRFEEDFFPIKDLHRGKNFFWQIYEGSYSTWGD